MRKIDLTSCSEAATARSTFVLPSIGISKVTHRAMAPRQRGLQTFQLKSHLCGRSLALNLDKKARSIHCAESDNAAAHPQQVLEKPGSAEASSSIHGWSDVSESADHETAAGSENPVTASSLELYIEDTPPIRNDGDAGLRQPPAKIISQAGCTEPVRQQIYNLEARCGAAAAVTVDQHVPLVHRYSSLTASSETASIPSVATSSTSQHSTLGRVQSFGLWTQLTGTAVPSLRIQTSQLDA